MNNIEAIILNELECMDDMKLHSVDDRAEVAHRVANKLIVASLQQFVDLTGGSVEYDNDGQVVIYTGLNAVGS